MDFSSVEEIINFFTNFYKLFDIVRIIDPYKRQIINFDHGGESHISNCYDFWQRGTYCSNCISMKAMDKRDGFVKIEYSNNKVFIIMASIVSLRGDEYIVELLKDITETGMITNLSGKTIKGTNDIIFKLHEETITDPLTGCYNRRYMNERFPSDIYTSSLYKKSLGVIMIDIDDFKNVNDSFGHLIGDKVLESLCKTLKSKIRKNEDWITRFGGEEFLIVLWDVNLDETYMVAEKIRRSWEEEVVEYKDHLIKTTISLGSYTMDSGDKTFYEILDIVDKNLYKAKKEGKNRIVAS